jgi:hypothetical protein
VCVATAVIAVGLLQRPEEKAGPCQIVHGPSMLPDIPEASGLAVSRRTPGILWSHNDSGHAAVLFALDASGNMRGHVRVPVSTRDWEDVSAGRCPSGDCLYIADIGDNSLSRRRIQIYRVPEPAPDEAATARPDIFSAAYPDGAHNAEALFVIDAALFIITKDRVGGLYRSPPLLGSAREITLERIGELGLRGVTDAEASPDGHVVVVRTLDEVLFYRTADLIRGAVPPVVRIPIGPLKEAQGEGVAWDGNGMLYLASEGRGWSPAGRLLGLRCSLSV